MIDIPLGKALVPVEIDLQESSCPACYFYQIRNCYKKTLCGQKNREDGKNVIFRLVDYPEKGEK
ncbi:MAG: hypothetical protein LBH43_21450 [Treponema sp.]|jgi:hypothetical protein|nr:hypothetical protein [Treponema sp.]